MSKKILPTKSTKNIAVFLCLHVHIHTHFLASHMTHWVILQLLVKFLMNMPSFTEGTPHLKINNNLNVIFKATF